jgi:hypothetical protein
MGGAYTYHCVILGYGIFPELFLRDSMPSIKNLSWQMFTWSKYYNRVQNPLIHNLVLDVVTDKSHLWPSHYTVISESVSH